MLRTPISKRFGNSYIEGGTEETPISTDRELIVSTTAPDTKYYIYSAKHSKTKSSHIERTPLDDITNLTEIELLKSDLEIEKEKNEELEIKLEQKAKALNQALEEIAQKKTEFRMMKKKITEAEDALKDEIEKKENQIEILRNENEGLRTEIEKIKEEIENIESLQRENERLKSKNEKNAELLKNLMEEKENAKCKEVEMYVEQVENFKSSLQEIIGRDIIESNKDNTEMELQTLFNEALEIIKGNEQASTHKEINLSEDIELECSPDDIKAAGNRVNEIISEMEEFGCPVEFTLQVGLASIRIKVNYADEIEAQRLSLPIFSEYLNMKTPNKTEKINYLLQAKPPISESFTDREFIENKIEVDYIAYSHQLEEEIISLQSKISYENDRDDMKDILSNCIHDAAQVRIYELEMLIEQLISEIVTKNSDKQDKSYSNISLTSLLENSKIDHPKEQHQKFSSNCSEQDLSICLDQSIADPARITFQKQDENSFVMNEDLSKSSIFIDCIDLTQNKFQRNSNSSTAFSLDITKDDFHKYHRNSSKSTATTLDSTKEEFIKEQEKFLEKKKLLKEKIKEVNERQKKLAEREKQCSERLTYITVQEKKYDCHRIALDEEWTRMDEQRQEVLKCRKIIDEEWKVLKKETEKLGWFKSQEKKNCEGKEDLESKRLKLEKDLLEFENEKMRIKEENKELITKIKKFQAEKRELCIEKSLLEKEKRDLEENRRELSLMIPNIKRLITTPK
ncbi:unnamed protein product [Blepharisma stoltei]|uniref:Uncharacterized protein n=1 Tax=Blepharisma stoltei TaxID=1481888 RepID=A0AAU9JZL9_9CILI|nr:unnamed protein product [Blepharisma stoltei]